jgi:hypothetical protein
MLQTVSGQFEAPAELYAGGYGRDAAAGPDISGGLDLGRGPLVLVVARHSAKILFSL